MPPSTLSLLGLVRHMAEVERTWFRRVIEGEDVPLVWSDRRRLPGGVRRRPAPTRAEAFAAWRPRSSTRAASSARPSPWTWPATSARWGEDVSLRLVMLHLIHEYARHNGHADFLREGVDGTIGA